MVLYTYGNTDVNIKRERGEAASGEVEIEERMFNFNKNNKKETKVIAQ